MDPYNLYPSLFPQYDNQRPPGDIRENDQAPQMTQNYDIYQQPSGVEVPRISTFLPRQAEISFPHSLPHDNTQTSWAMTASITDSSTNFEESFCAPSREGSVSPSPSHRHILQASHSGKSHFPKYVVALNSSRSQPSTCSAALSRPPISTLDPRGEAIPSDASQYAEAPRQDSAILRISSMIAQPTSHVPDPTPLDRTGLFNDTDNLRVANAQNALLSHNLPGHRFAPSAYQLFPEQSCLLSATSNARSLSFQSMDIIAGRLSQNQNGFLAVTDTDDFSPSLASFGSQEDLVDASPSPELPSALAQGASSQAVDPRLLPKSLSPAVPQPADMQRHTRKRKRAAEPKDPKAAKRLRGQRQSDDDCIKALCDMFVPKDLESVMKKNRLQLGTALRSFLL